MTIFSFGLLRGGQQKLRNLRTCIQVRIYVIHLFEVMFSTLLDDMFIMQSGNI